MTRPAENQQTVEAALDYMERITLSLGPGERTERLDAARAALRDLVAQAERAVVADAASVMAEAERDASDEASATWATLLAETQIERDEWKELALDMGRVLEAGLRLHKRTFPHRRAWLSACKRWEAKIPPLLARLDGVAAGKEMK